MLLMLLLLTINAQPNFVHWTLHTSTECGVPTSSVALLPNLYPCANTVSAVYSLFTHFEGKPHSFSFTACSDDLIYVGLRIDHGHTLVYMEFVSFVEFEAFMNECVLLLCEERNVPAAHYCD